ncbi:MAG: hypothetical protein K0S65_68 [Labilithrix sp.]|nr:hypothetical protein [Labilithrix sp.]
MIQVLIGAHTRPLDGGVSGDAFAQFTSKRGPIVALSDGLGHGERAAEASAVFLGCVRDNADQPLEMLFMRAHHSLMKTRGVVAAIARFDETRREVEVGGLGNVSVLVVRGGNRGIPILLQPGVLGSAYRKVRPQTLPFAVNDVLVLYTDGVRTRFDVGVTRTLAPQATAEEIVRIAGKATDDAGVVVARAVLPAIVPEKTRPILPTVEARGPVGPLEPRVVPIRVRGDDATCALEARSYAQRAALLPREQWEVSIAASELATNVLKFAGSGTMTLSFDGEELVLDVIDRGRGIEAVASAVVDGWSEGGPLGPDSPRHDRQGLGVGLGSVHRMMTHVAIETTPGQGTRIVARKTKT